MKLEELLLSENKIGDEGAEAISKVLKTGRPTKILRLEYCNIGDRGAYRIMEALRDDTTLEYLFLKGNRITEECRKRLEECCAEIPSLKPFF